MSQNPDVSSDPQTDLSSEGERPETVQEDEDSAGEDDDPDPAARTGAREDLRSGSRDLSRDTEVGESDPSADSADGLAGGMGVSSERVGPARGEAGDVTYGVLDTHQPTPAADETPEQSADPAAGAEVRPDEPELKEHPAEDPAFRGPAAYEG